MKNKNVWKSDRRWEPEKFENLKLWKHENDPKDMLNYFCFYVYAQKSLFKVENVNDFFYLLILTTLPCEFVNHRAGSQLKISFFILLQFWTFQASGASFEFYMGARQFIHPC